MVIMVDTRGVKTRTADSPIQVFSGCSPVVAAAINRFSRRWKRHSVRSRRYPIYVLLADVVDGAWCGYVASLPSNYPGRSLCEGQLLSIIAERNGFRFFDDLYSCIVNSIESDRALLTWNQTHGGNLTIAFDDQVHAEFRATVSTLRELGARCDGKEPQKIRAGKLNSQRHRPHCEFCGEPTELGSVLGGAAWPSLDVNRRASLSGRYCVSHRSKNHDGSWNPSYTRARRNRVRFELEMSRIKHHTCNVPDLRFADEKGLADPFLWCLTHSSDIYLDESERIRKLARELIDAKMGTRKRQVAMLLATNHSQAEAARTLNVSRQAISKMWRSPALREFLGKYPEFASTSST